MRLFIILSLTLLLQAFAAPEGALLALDREIDGDLVQSKNATVTYTLHNVGSSSASNVLLKDLSFPLSRFAIYQGAPKQTWNSLPAGEVRTAVMTVSPKRAGELIVSPATVSYNEGRAKRVTKLACDDSFVVEDLLSWRRRTDKHRREWGLFAGAFALLVVVPGLVGTMLERAVPQAKKKV